MAADRFKTPAGVSPYNPLDDAQARAIAEDMDLHREELDFAVEIMCQQAMDYAKIARNTCKQSNKNVSESTHGNQESQPSAKFMP
jgi:hypothetical protein